jgi:flavin reductase (DIM6/NTAB) family NADH-FMN oxidoreductase RutF
MKVVDIGQAMKEGMRRLASGVCVITASDANGEPCAMTATSVTSVSDSPASLLVCINEDTRVYEALQLPNSKFCINLLSAEHEEISNRCAFGDSGLSRFELGDWNMSATEPYLESALACFMCTRDEMIDYGTHGILIGRIDRVLVNETEGDIEKINPLVYLNGNYHTL